MAAVFVSELCIGTIRGTFASMTTTTSSNIHAVVVSSSRYWFNYGHAMNALGIYRVLKNKKESPIRKSF
jgi:glycosylphosphatidylinositol transamidase (GPIT) subunit GPI8